MGIIYVTNLYVNSFCNKEFNKQFYEIFFCMSMCCVMMTFIDLNESKVILFWLIACWLKNLINLMILGLQLVSEFTARLLPREMRIVLLYLGDEIKWNCMQIFGLTVLAGIFFYKIINSNLRSIFYI